jgi:putative ABC transport system permease protein
LSSLSAASGISDGGLLIDTTDAKLLGFDPLSPLSGHVQVAGRRAHMFGTTTGFSSFLGAPLVLGSYQDIRRYLRFDRSEVAMVFARIASGQNAAMVRDRLRARFTDVDVWTANEFSTRSRIFWLIQTGAGAALSLAAVLGFSIGLVMVAQTMYAVTTENIEEFATLRALGASDADIRSIVLTQSLICGFIGGTVGLLFVEPFTSLARATITWATVPSWMYVLIPMLILILCIGAAHIAARPALTVDPGRVFRA